MWSRTNLVGALAFIAAAAAGLALPAWLVSLATIAFANGVGVLGLGNLWRGRTRPLRAGAVLRYRRLCSGAAQPLCRLGGRVPAGRHWRGGGRHRRVPGRISARALSRHLLRDAEPRDVDDPLRRAGEDPDTRIDRRFPRRGGVVPRLCAPRPGAQSHAVLARAGGFGDRPLANQPLLPPRPRRAPGARARPRHPPRIPRPPPPS